MEEDLKEVEDNPEYVDIEKKAYNVIQEITDQNITEPYLQQIYLENTDEAIKELHIVRQKKQWKKEYEHDLLMAFWFAIDMQNIELANKLINWDLSIRYIAVLAIRGLKERPKNFKVRHQNKVLGMKRFMNFQESQKQHAEQVFAAFNSGQGEPE